MSASPSRSAPRTALPTLAWAAHVLAALGLLGGCGHSAASIRRAQEAKYDAPFATVWKVCTEETHRRYLGIHFEDAASGVIETDYRVIERASQDIAGASPAGAPATGAYGNLTAQQSRTQAQAQQTGDSAIFRMIIRIYGPPWRVHVDGVAAEYKPGMALPVPFPRGAIDEPPWVQARIDNLTMAIYQRLEPYAVIEAAKAVVAPRETDTAAWGNVAREAALAIAAVRKAATDRDPVALRGYMITDFRWSDGGDASADTALALWAADPTVLSTLVRTLEAGCAPEEGQGVVCPKTPASDLGHARFRQVESTWKLVEFLR